jgi:hypothetical protein
VIFPASQGSVGGIPSASVSRAAYSPAKVSSPSRYRVDSARLTVAAIRNFLLIELRSDILRRLLHLPGKFIRSRV